MEFMCIAGGKVYTQEKVIEKGVIIWNEQGKIEAVGGEELLESYSGNIHRVQEHECIVPGFIDIHVHGSNGFHMMMADYESVDELSRYYAKYGTTSFLATTTTASGEEITAALENANQVIAQGVSGAELLGVHLEGPYLDLVRSGAQDPQHIREPDIQELEQFLEASGHQIRLVTLAPELRGGAEAVRLLVDRGITVSIGHSNATYEEVEQAIALGVNHTTHHFNGMSPFHHRDPGVAGAGLIKEELTTELIADGIHVHPDIIKLLFQVKGPYGICMITDAVTVAGLPDGDYDRVIMKNGKIMLRDGSSLAGSSLTMIEALRNVMNYTGLPMEAVLPSMTIVPARQIRALDRKGTLEAGKDADFVILSGNHSVQATYVQGKQVYSALN